MPTKRFSVSALCTGTALIVAGGLNDNNQKLKTVELLDIETQQWHTAPDLPEPLTESSLTLCQGGFVYLLGGHDEVNAGTSSVYSCSVSSLHLSTGSKSNSLAQSSVWNRVASLPVTLSTAVTLHGQLLAVGGWDQDATTAIHMYQPITNSWEVISRMTIPRALCLVAVLPDNQLMVVGGWTTGNKLSNAVKFGTTVNREYFVSKIFRAINFRVK